MDMEQVDYSPGLLATGLNSRPVDYLHPAGPQPSLGKTGIKRTVHDRANKAWEIGLNGLWGVLRAVDTTLTADALRNHGAREIMAPTNWVYRNFGTPGMYVQDAFLTAGGYGLSRLLDKNVAPWAGIALPVLGAILQGFVIAKNINTMKKWR